MRVLFVKQELSQVHIVTPVPGVTGTETYHPRYWCISGMQDQLCTGMLDMVKSVQIQTIHRIDSHGRSEDA